jgi:glyoxylase-like metal-dependent hydrolase (beta-lactamase superfamily II)
MQPIFHDLDFGITCIDTQHIKEDFVASYLLIENNKAAFIDTGCHLSVPILLNVLTTKNIAAEDVEFILITHIHLDHAGGAGELIKHLPNAKIFVHEYGAHHLIDPSKLKSSVVEVYGEIFFKQFLGDLLPIDAHKIHVATDQTSIFLNNRALKFINTPGHARHHICIWDEKSNSIFSGDTLGVSYKTLETKQGPLIFLPSSPTQFDPETWKETIKQLTALKPKYAYLTHFNAILWSDEIANELIQCIDDFVDIAYRYKNEENRHQTIKNALSNYLLQKTKKHGVLLEKSKIIKLIKGDLEICTQGLEVWLENVS